MAERKYSFDSACYDLAEHFYPGAPKEKLDELAQRFQDQVEGGASADLDAWQEAMDQYKADERARAKDARDGDWASYYP